MSLFYNGVILSRNIASISLTVGDSTLCVNNADTITLVSITACIISLLPVLNLSLD